MDKNEKKNQLFKRGTTWCSAADCFNNKIADPSIAFFVSPKIKKGTVRDATKYCEFSALVKLPMST